MHNLKANIARFRALLQELMADKLNAASNLRFYPNPPKASDLDILALAITAEALSIPSQNLLFSKIAHEHPDLASSLPDRSNYNRRLRRLEPFIDLPARAVLEHVQQPGTTFLIDSMPLPVCRNARISRLKILKDEIHLAPARGYTATDRIYLYGYKLHDLTDAKGLIYNYCITAANLHDVSLLPDLAPGHIANAMLLADKGYISRQGQLDLFEHDKIRLITPDRANAIQAQKLWNASHRLARKRIETLFSQLCDQFSIKQNYAKRCIGYLVRIRAKITALTLLQYLNLKRNKGSETQPGFLTAQWVGKLFVSEKTIENHRYNMAKKLELVGGQNSLLVFALEQSESLL